MSDEPRKRSRFDQTEPPEPVRKSRFDRRSRSPARRESGTQHRSRSPVVSKGIDSPSGAGESKTDAVAAAAAAAARINAGISAKKAAQHVDVPPVRPTHSPSASAGAAKSPTSGDPGDNLNAEIYTQDGDYIKDIEVNDLRNRYTLTKGSTQKMIKEKTGADVTTRGSYFPDKSMATPANPPLYLHVTSTSKDGLERAVAEIEEMMKQELPNLIDERRFRRGRGDGDNPNPHQDRDGRPVERDALGRRKWPEERIPIDLEPIPGFNLRAQVVGAGGSYVKHIQQETRCRVQIKGRGSGFMEHDTGVESDEQMYLHVAGPDPDEVQRAKGLCLELLEHVRESYEAFKERGPRGGGNRGGYNQGGYGGDDQRQGGYHERDRNGSGSYGGQGNNSQYGYGYGGQQGAGGYSGGAQSPTAATSATSAAGAGTDPNQQATIAAWIQYYSANPDQDPYREHGGYGAIIAYYNYDANAMAQGMAMAQAQAQGAYGTGMSQSPVQGQYGNGAGSAPPPPPSDDVPPPPPPPGA